MLRIYLQRKEQVYVIWGNAFHFTGPHYARL